MVIVIVYKIQNKINGKIYIGMTKYSLDGRVVNHLQNKSHIGSALRKYGLQSFDISVIDTAEDRETLADKEMFWISFYDSKVPNGYNLTAGGEGCFDPSEETRKKMREKAQKRLKRPTSKETRKKISVARMNHSVTEEAREKMSKNNIGKHFASEETRAKMRENSVGRRGQHTPEETRKKQRESNIGKHNPSEETREKLRNSHLGYSPTEEARKNLSNSIKESWATGKLSKRSSRNKK